MAVAYPVTLSFLETLDFWTDGLDGARNVAAEDVGILGMNKAWSLDFPVDGIGSDGGVLG